VLNGEKRNVMAHNGGRINYFRMAPTIKRVLSSEMNSLGARRCWFEPYLNTVDLSPS
jgi:hypothetical protein